MSTKVLADLDFNGSTKITNLPDPVSAQDAATKNYVDVAIEGTNWKDSVRVSTQGNVSIASPGASIDGITMSANDRVLVRAQTSASENGIYIWNGAATPMTRSADCSTAAELEQAVTLVEEGTNAGVSYRQTLVNFTLGSGSVAFTVAFQSTPTASETQSGIAEIATQAETDAGTDDTRFVTPLKLATYSGRVKKFSALIGDGAATQYDVTHNFNTTDVHIQVYLVSTGESVLVDTKRQTVNAARINFASAPANNAYKVVVIG